MENLEVFWMVLLTNSCNRCSFDISWITTDKHMNSTESRKISTEIKSQLLLKHHVERHLYPSLYWWPFCRCTWVSRLLMTCMWSSWCHCHLIISCFIKIQNNDAKTRFFSITGHWSAETSLLPVIKRHHHLTTRWLICRPVQHETHVTLLVTVAACWPRAYR